MPTPVKMPRLGESVAEGTIGAWIKQEGDYIEKDEAIAWLEQAYGEHDQWMVYINAYPGWDALRSEPRFQALVRRMNFPR